MTKSYAGLVAAILEAEGKLDVNKPVSFYLPGLVDEQNIGAIKYGIEDEFGNRDNKHYDEITVRNLLDMTSATSFSEAKHSSLMFGSAGASSSSTKPGAGTSGYSSPFTMYVASVSVTFLHPVLLSASSYL